MKGDSPARNRPASRKGFTLIEVLVAVFIGVLLAGMVTVNVVRYVSESRVKAARIQIRELRSAVEQYIAEQGQPPTMEQGLDALVRPPTIPPLPRSYPPGGYLSSRRIPRDPWGREYIYVVPGPDNQPFEILSYGSDGEPGGEGHAADISSADLGEF